MDSYVPSDADPLNPDAPDLHHQYRQTKDIRFAAMAVGRWPSSPPVWAILACYGAHEAWLRTTSKGHAAVKIGKILDEMLMVYFDCEYAHYDSQVGSTQKYKPPTRVSVLRKAMERLEEDDPEVSFRATLVAIDRAMTEEAEAERNAKGRLPRRDTNGLHVTKRHRRVVLEHEAERNGGPSYRLSLLKFLQDVAASLD